jgi:hypothetical protein
VRQRLALWVRRGFHEDALQEAIHKRDDPGRRILAREGVDPALECLVGLVCMSESKGMRGAV